VALGALRDALRGTDKGGTWTDALPVLLGQVLLVAVLLGLVWLCYRAASSFAALPPWARRNPQISLHALFWITLAALWIISPEAGIGQIVLVGLVVAMPFFLWRMGYLLLSGQRGRAAGTRFRDHLLYFWPLYGGSNTPYGKGLDYLSSHEAKDEEALAVAQLAGFRLLLLAGLWHLCRILMNGLVFGVDNAARQAAGGFCLGVPRLGLLLEQPETAGWGMSWASLYCDLVIDVLNRATKGHLIIGVLRLFGFYVFRNTYKPLLAPTVVEFWNRYYYYFKEVMVDFFFYPAFARWFRKRRVLRLFAAVFMAAFVGNMYYHLIRMSAELARADFEAVWLALHARLFYCLLLALGIFVSMYRDQRRTGPGRTGNRMRRGAAIFGVWTFFAIINIWNQKGPVTFLPLTRFFLGLLGVG
jgi:hypothetical protein